LPTQIQLDDCRAIDKASQAYGASIASDHGKAIEDLRARPHRLDHCMRAMQMDRVSKAQLWARIRAQRVGLPG
jgi:hypothetical protein